jgi:hypothetical protein
MRVNNYTLKIPTMSGSTGLKIDLPISQSIGLASQSEIIESKFVNVEVENSINRTFDYEKVKFLPKNSLNDNLVNGILYKLNFIDNGAYPSNTYWSNIGLTNNDFKFRKNGFVKSFLRLDFYDTDITSTQRLLFFITLFPKFNLNDLQSNGTHPQPSNYSVTFRLGNNIIDKKVNGEGFAIYYFKDEVLPTVPKELYMRATFNNAKTGKTTRFMSNNNLNLSIDNLIKTTSGTNLVNNLHTRYLLERDVDGYYYRLDSTYSNNILNSSDNYSINLYEISVQ